MATGHPAPLYHLVKRSGAAAAETANELLEKLRQLAALGPLKSVMNGNADTAIGRTLEHHLGISMNSSKDPDYKGIELKAARVRRSKPRAQLFCQVPDWRISKFKSFAQVLAKFGQGSGASRRLHCTVRATASNPRGLSLEVNAHGTLLHEVSSDKSIGRFATWSMSKLEARLAYKHRETFWIKARSTTIGGVEHFEFTSVVHTRKPLASEFAALLQTGAITVDHLIKMKGTAAKEGGPSFKISAASFDVLFPPNKTYHLV